MPSPLTDGQLEALHRLAVDADVPVDEMTRRAVELGLVALDTGHEPTHRWPPRNGDALARRHHAEVARRKARESQPQGATP